MNHLLLLLSLTSLFILTIATNNVPSREGSKTSTLSPSPSPDFPIKTTKYENQLITLQGSGQGEMIKKIIATVTVNEYSNGHQDFSLDPKTAAEQLVSGHFCKNPTEYTWFAINKSDIKVNGVPVYLPANNNELITMQPEVKDAIVHYYSQYTDDVPRTKNEWYELFLSPILYFCLGTISFSSLLAWAAIKWFCRPVRKSAK